MDSGELGLKLQNQGICRFCLNENIVELSALSDVNIQNEYTCMEIIEKFNLVEVSVVFLEYFCQCPQLCLNLSRIYPHLM